ncbi:MAG: hypothetical protein SYC29_15010 [Planctomycetota bacterium]|nr:hypothetical protein [Planctomycetota bacterium]
MIAGADLTGLALETLETQIFEPALEAIDRHFENQPLIRASLLQTVASTTRDLGLLDLATAPQEQALPVGGARIRVRFRGGCRLRAGGRDDRERLGQYRRRALL